MKPIDVYIMLEGGETDSEIREGRTLIGVSPAFEDQRCFTLYAMPMTIWTGNGCYHSADLQAKLLGMQ